MRTKALLTAVTHIAIGIVATVALLAVLFATGVLDCDGPKAYFVMKTPSSWGYTGRPVTTRIIFWTARLVQFSLLIAGLFSGLSYALFGRRKQ